MPYDFSFRRIVILNNQQALENNIALAMELIKSFPEINDENSPDSNYYFTKTVIDHTKEYPEQHFYIKSETGSFFYYFSFWKDNLYVELGAGDNVIERFKHLKDYSKVILNHGFQIEDPLGNELLSEDVGFEKHIEEYKKWAGFVEYVRDITKEA